MTTADRISLHLTVGPGADQRNALAYAAQTGDPMDAIRWLRGELKVQVVILRGPDPDAGDEPDWYEHEYTPAGDEFVYGTEPVDEPDHQPPPPRAPVEPGEPLYARTQPIPQWQPGGPRAEPDMEQVAAAMDPVPRIRERETNRIPRERSQSEYDSGHPDYGPYHRDRGGR